MHKFKFYLSFHLVLDAWGKPGGGLFTGNLGHVGDYDECVDTVIPDLKDPDGNPQRGMYCLTTFVPLLPKKPQLYTLFHKIPELANISAKETVSIVKNYLCKKQKKKLLYQIFFVIKKNID